MKDERKRELEKLRLFWNKTKIKYIIDNWEKYVWYFYGETRVCCEIFIVART